MACGEFFQCIDGEPHGRACREGLWFSLNQQRCTEPYDTRCELDEILCLGVEDEVAVRAPTSCSEFFVCVRGTPFPGRCFNNLFFNEETGLCEPREDVDCDLEIPIEPPLGPCDQVPDFLLARNPENCEGYFICYNNEILNDEELFCPDGQIFDVRTQVCGPDFECVL
jgi:hypothetical protein